MMVKKIIILILILKSFIQIEGKTFNTIDSIRVVGLQYEVLELSRFNFLKEIEECKRIFRNAKNESFESLAQVSYVDSIITNKDEIKTIVSNIKTLKKEQKMSFDSQCDLLIAYYNQTNGSIIWCPVDQQSPSLLLVLFIQDRVELIWLNKYLVDIGQSRYRISKDLAKSLSRYTRIYDSLFNIR